MRRRIQKHRLAGWQSGWAVGSGKRAGREAHSIKGWGQGLWHGMRGAQGALMGPRKLVSCECCFGIYVPEAFICRSEVGRGRCR